MTRYENPKIPEGINYSQNSGFKDFFGMLAGAVLLVVCVVLSMALLSRYALTAISFEQERKIAELVDFELPERSEGDQRIQQYLQALADQLLESAPFDYPVTVHYVPEGEVNAYATIGGHIIINGSLLSRLESENALAMLLGHEIAHIQHRDPIVSLGQGVLVGVMLSVVTGNESGAGWLISSFSEISNMAFSREQESKADDLSLQMLRKTYGHVNGADQLFVALDGATGELLKGTPEWLSTHPINKHRIAKIKAFTEGLDSSRKTLKPLPDFIPSVL